MPSSRLTVCVGHAGPRGELALRRGPPWRARPSAAAPVTSDIMVQRPATRGRTDTPRDIYGFPGAGTRIKIINVQSGAGLRRAPPPTKALTLPHEETLMSKATSP